MQLTRTAISKLLAGPKPVELFRRDGSYCDLRERHLENFDDDPYEVVEHPHVIIVKERKRRFTHPPQP